MTMHCHADWIDRIVRSGMYCIVMPSIALDAGSTCG